MLIRKDRRYRGRFIIFMAAILILSIFGSIARAALEPHPDFDQKLGDDCVVAAVASCLKWLQDRDVGQFGTPYQTSFPNLKTRNPAEGKDWKAESSDVEDIYKQLLKDSKEIGIKTGYDVKYAMEKLVEPSYKDYLKVKHTGPEAVTPDFLWEEYKKEEDIVIGYQRPPKNPADPDEKPSTHWVTINSIYFEPSTNGENKEIELSVMDPGLKNGTDKQNDVNNVKISQPIKGGTASYSHEVQTSPEAAADAGKIIGAYTVSPDYHVASKHLGKIQNADETIEGEGLEYTVQFNPAASTGVPTDIHIKVWDCDPKNWIVKECPEGWGPGFQVKKVVENGKEICFFTLAQTKKDKPIKNGDKIVLIYIGKNKVDKAGAAIRLSKSPLEGEPGAERYDPTKNIISHNDGYTVICWTDPEPPSVPGNACLGPHDAGGLLISWQPSSDNVGVVNYTVYDANAGMPVAVTTETFYVFSGPESNSYNCYYVTASDGVGNTSQPSPTVAAYIDEMATESIPTGLNIMAHLYLTTVVSDSGATVDLGFGEVSQPGTIYNNSYFSQPLVHPPTDYVFLEPYYDVTTTAVYTKPISVTLPYSSVLDSDKEDNLQMFHLENGEWVNVTTSIDTTNDRITGQVKSLSPFAVGYLVSSSGPIIGTGVNSYWIGTFALGLLLSGTWLIRRRQAAG